MNLGDLMNQLADDVDTRALPGADQIRHTGDRLRVRRRRRIAVTAAAAAIVAVAATTAITQSLTRSTPEPAGRLDGWQITRTVEVPGNGGALYADGSLWAIDNKDGELTTDGTPAAELYQIDPKTGDVLDRVPGAAMGWWSVGAGAIWASDVTLEVLARIDLASHQVTRIPIHHPKQHPQGSAVAEGNLWVINNSSGDLLQMDPQTYRLRQTIHLGAYDSGTAPRSIITDGHSLWVSNDNGLVMRFDGATGEEQSRLQLPIRAILFDGIDPSRHAVYAHELRGTSLFEIDTTDPRRDRIGNELQLTQSVDGMILGFAASPGSLWTATTYPDELLRIDPDTFEITARTPLPGMDHQSNVPVALAAGGGALWIRLEDKVMELRPQHD